MQIYKLAKRIILSSIVGLIIILCCDVYEAYQVTYDPPIEIYTNSAYFYLHYAHQHSREGNKWRRLKQDRNVRFEPGEIYGYNHKGTRFLIKVLVKGLRAKTPAGVEVLLNDGKYGTMEQIGEEVTEDTYFTYSPSHWLSFLFSKKTKISLSDLVNDYIPKREWVVSGNPFSTDDSAKNRASTLLSPPFKINKNEQAYQAFRSQFRYPRVDQLASPMNSISFYPESKLAIKYQGEEILLEAGKTTKEGQEYAFGVTNAAAPNKWMCEKRQGGNFYYGLEINDPDVTLFFGDEAYTIEQVLDSYLFR